MTLGAFSSYSSFIQSYLLLFVFLAREKICTVMACSPGAPRGRGVAPLLSAVSFLYIYISIEDFIIFYCSLKSIYTLQTP